LAAALTDSDRLLAGELEPGGWNRISARRSCWNHTRFLSGGLRAYELHLQEGGSVDEHGARTVLSSQASASRSGMPSSRSVDRPFDADGYWPADGHDAYEHPGLGSIDIVATRNTLDAGSSIWLRLAFVEIEEGTDLQRRPSEGAAATSTSLVLFRTP
jgi:hypothetical protein